MRLEKRSRCGGKRVPKTLTSPPAGRARHGADLTPPSLSLSLHPSSQAAIDSADLPTASAGGAGPGGGGDPNGADPAAGPDGGAAADAAHTFVWGTAIDIASIAARLRRFLQQFEVPGSGVKKYVNLLQQVKRRGRERREGEREIQTGRARARARALFLFSTSPHF